MSGGRASGIAVALLAGLVLLAWPAAAPAGHSVPELLSTGPGPGGGRFVDLHSASPDGRRVLMRTDSALVPEDVDNCDDPDIGNRRCTDYYDRFGGTTSLLTTGPTDPHASLDTPLETASRDASRVFFNTPVPLVPEDTDFATDAYERAGGVTTLISTGPSGPGPGAASVRGVSEAGLRAFFFSPDRLLPEDDDDCTDLYERSAGTTKLVTTAVTAGPGSLCAGFIWGRVSADGSRVFLITDAQRSAADTDDSADIYEWSGGEATLISTGPADAGADSFPLDLIAVSRDGGHVFFTTRARLVPEDTDTAVDLYERFDGTTRLVVPPAAGDSSPSGSFQAMTPDASRVFFVSTAALLPEDTDAGSDVYERSGEDLTLISTGPLGSDGQAHWTGGGPLLGTEHGDYDGMSADGRSVLFASTDPFVPEDTDGVQDIYLRANGETVLVSTGPNDANRSFPVNSALVLISPDGSRVFFTSFDQLVPADTDDQADVYEWHDGHTTLVPNGVPTPAGTSLPPVRAQQTVVDGTRVFVQSVSRLTPADTDSTNDLYAVDLANEPPACDAVAATPERLWPANRRLVRIALGGATDPDADEVTLEITGVTQDERTGASRDAVLSSARDEVRLRAERDNRGDGRVYRIAFEATDGNGGSCSGTAKVSVPRKKHKDAVDSAPPSHDSFG